MCVHVVSTNSNLTSKNYILERSGSNDYKVSFKWEMGDDYVWSLVGYIGDVAVFRIRQNFDAQILDKKVYTFTADSTNLKDGGVQVIKQGNFLHFKVAIALNPNALDAWTNLKIGTLSNWTGVAYNTVCVLSTLSSSPATLALNIDAEGNVFVSTQVPYTSGLNRWFHGYSQLVGS